MSGDIGDEGRLGYLGAIAATDLETAGFVSEWIEGPVDLAVPEIDGGRGCGRWSARNLCVGQVAIGSAVSVGGLVFLTAIGIGRSDQTTPPP